MATRHAPVADREPIGVPAGPMAYRRRLRAAGPLVALLLPALGVAVAALLWQTVSCTGSDCFRTGASAWFAAAIALPTALLFGLPWHGGTGRYAAVVVTSAMVWMAVGALAARLATRKPVASWRDWWVEYVWIAAGVCGGVIAALGITAVFVSHRVLP